MENVKRDKCLYRGHRIWVEAQKDDSGAWAWCYVVEGPATAASRGNGPLPDAASALRFGLDAAKAHIESTVRSDKRVGGA